MITIRDIKVEKTYVDFKYWQTKYETSLTLKLAGSYQDSKITLTDEQTAKVVALIVEMATANLTIAHEADPAPPQDDAAQLEQAA